MAPDARIHNVCATFPCPLQFDVGGIRWAEPHPLPGFIEPGGAYYSPVFNTAYLPLVASNACGNSIWQLVPADRAPAIVAMLSHELIGHRTMYSRSSLMRWLRFNMRLIYMGLHAVFDPGLTVDNMHPSGWALFNDQNARVIQVINAITLVEELFATITGFAVMRLPTIHTGLKPGAIDSVEDEFVARQAADDRFGSRFVELYGQLDRLVRRFGLGRVQAIRLYCEELLACGDGPSRGITFGELNSASACGRLAQGIAALEAMSGAERRQVEADELSLGTYLRAQITEFDSWANDYTAAWRALTEDPSVFRAWSKAWRGFSPLRGLRATDSDRVLGFGALRRGDPVLDGLENTHDLPFLSGLDECEHEAVVVLAGAQSGDIGACFIPVPVGAGDGRVRPALRILSDAPVSPKLRRDLAALTFYEGLRMQLASRTGVRCPLAGGRRCCGRFATVRLIWEAGCRFEPALQSSGHWALSACAG